MVAEDSFYLTYKQPYNYAVFVQQRQRNYYASFQATPTKELIETIKQINVNVS